MARICLTASGLSFEVECDEDFIEKSLSSINDFIEALNKKNLPIVQGQSSPELVDVEKDNKTLRSSNTASKTRKTAKKKESFSIVKELDLHPQDKQDLRAFFAEKSPSSALEKTAVFVYYLKSILKADNITPDHLYTCYKYVGVPVPGNLRQNIIDTASRKGAIDTSDMMNIQITTAGENFVEYELPKENAK